MKSYILLTIAILLVSPVLMGAQDWPLKITAEPEWQIRYKGEGIDFFELHRPRGENVFFIFSKWPAPGGKDQIPHLVKKIADNLLDKEKTNRMFAFIYDDYQIEQIEGKQFSGQAAVFRDPLGMLQTIFMISDGDGIWNGQFSGSKAIWEKAKAILEKLERAK